MTTKTKKRGFASMSSEQRKRIASMGGTAAHQQGKAHVFTSEEARAAGSKGGLARGGPRLMRPALEWSKA